MLQLPALHSFFYISAHTQTLHSAFNFAFNLALNYTIKIDLLNQYYIQALTKVFCTPLWKYAKWHHPQAMHKFFNKLQLCDMSVLNRFFNKKKKALFFAMELHLNQVFLWIKKVLVPLYMVFLGLRSIKTLKGLRRKVVETRNSIDTIFPKIFSNTWYHSHGNTGSTSLSKQANQIKGPISPWSSEVNHSWIWRDICHHAGFSWIFRSLNSLNLNELKNYQECFMIPFWSCSHR